MTARLLSLVIGFAGLHLLRAAFPDTKTFLLASLGVVTLIASAWLFQIASSSGGRAE